jgi:deoxyhypusine synthase
MIYFHSYKTPGLVVDLVGGESVLWCAWLSSALIDDHADIRALNSEAVFAKRTGMIILGGGLIKHHIFNANLMVSHCRMRSSSFKADVACAAQRRALLRRREHGQRV